MAKESESDREEVQDHYCGHDIDIDTAKDRFSILDDGAKDSPVMTSDHDTKVKLGPKEQPDPNDPYP